MTDSYQIVPWFNSEEWLKVYNNLSDISSEKQEALNILLIWKARCPSLPSGIESTLSLLQVLVNDISKENEDVAIDQLLRLAYSSAIMRFVNHMLDTATAKGTSLYRAAKNLGVPDWIVDLRHDTAHSNNLPSITLLREACMISLQWLRTNYWDKHKEHIQDYVCGQKQIQNIDHSKVTTLLNFAVSLSICAHSNCKIKRLSQIPDAEMKESIVNEASDLFGNQVDFSNLKTVSITSLINITNLHIKRELKGRDVAAHVNEALLGPDSLILSKELFKYFGYKDRRNKRMRKKYMQFFEVLLTMLHTNELLLEFILSLIKITQSKDTDAFKAELAALWVSEILKALKKCQCFIKKLKITDSEDITTKKKTELKQLYNHWFPNDTSNSLILDLATPVPRELMDINFIQPIIATYNPNLYYFVKDLLSLIEPTLPTMVSQKICMLAELISVSNKIPVCSTSKTYTASDLKTAAESSDDSIEIIENDDKINIVYTENVSEDLNSGIWTLASVEHSWSSCPIGALPWRYVVDTTAEMET